MLMTWHKEGGEVKPKEGVDYICIANVYEFSDIDDPYHTKFVEDTLLCSWEPDIGEHGAWHIKHTPQGKWYGCKILEFMEIVYKDI